MNDNSFQSARMREALVLAKSSVAEMRTAIERTAAQLGMEQKQLDDALRRGRLAEDIGDSETASVAAHFAGRHREKVAVLQKKLDAQRTELDLAEREVREMTDKLRGTSGGSPADAGLPPEPVDIDAALERARLERETREAAAEAQLRELKRRMGRQGE